MSYFSPDVIAREQVLAAESPPQAVVAAVAAITGAFPIPFRRRRFTATLPIAVTIRRAFTFNTSMSRVIRSLWTGEALMSRDVRRRFTESFTQKRLVINKRFKELLRTVKEYILEE